MAEFAKVAHEWVRMCKAYSGAGDCMKCPMVINPMCGCMSDDNGVSEKEITKAEADIMSWAAEHLEPVYPTWLEWLEAQKIVSVAKREYTETIYDIVLPKPKMFDSIPADIAQKLGIEPKEDIC